MTINRGCHPMTPCPSLGPSRSTAPSPRPTHERGRRRHGGARVRGGVLESAAADIKPTSSSILELLTLPLPFSPSSQAPTIFTRQLDTSQTHTSVNMVVYIAAFGANSAVGGNVKESLLPEYESMSPPSRFWGPADTKYLHFPCSSRACLDRPCLWSR